jgi:hypothetical protein
MDTIGSIVDKLAIAQKRKEVFAKDSKFSDVEELEQQMGFLLGEIARIMYSSAAGERPWGYKKKKIYDQNIEASVDDENLFDLISELNRITRKLWDLEDKRRDSSVPNDERLHACDKVSEMNKKRNDVIDKIDALVEKYFNASHEVLLSNEAGTIKKVNEKNGIV